MGLPTVKCAVDTPVARGAGWHGSPRAPGDQDCRRAKRKGLLAGVQLALQSVGHSSGLTSVTLSSSPAEKHIMTVDKQAWSRVHRGRGLFQACHCGHGLWPGHWDAGSAFSKRPSSVLGSTRGLQTSTWIPNLLQRHCYL